MDEQSLLDTSDLKSRCASMVKGSTKSFGWFVQQFIKLGVSRYIPELSNLYVVYDADNLLVYPMNLFDNSERIKLPYRSRYSNGYDVFYEQAFNFPAPRRNYVVGYMVMNKTIVNEMLSYLDQKWGEKFPSTICKIGEYNEGNMSHSLFSEYFFYASWLKLKHPHLIDSEYSWDPVRNPRKYHAAASNGNCCPQQKDICGSVKQKEKDFFVTIEEHKYRFRDNLCRDGWQLL
jgi:hypothetical protein